MNSSEDKKPQLTLVEEREQAIREMESGLRRRPLGIRWPTALAAIVLTFVLFGWYRMDRDLAYFFSPGDPITLGSEGDYRFENLRSNRYAQVHGIPTHIGTFSRHGSEDDVRVTVGLQGTPILVHRAALPSEDWPPGRPPSAVDQRPFGIRGRLLVEDDARRFQEAFDRIGKLESVEPRDGKFWILVEGERPRGDLGTVALSALLFAFVMLNVWFLLRDLASRRADRSGTGG